MQTPQSTPITGTRQPAYSPNLDASLTVVSCGWDKRTAEREGEDAIIAGLVMVDRYTATQDGRGYIAEWHTGPESGETVYVERVDHNELQFHGWVDSVSRRIVQAG